MSDGSLQTVFQYRYRIPAPSRSALLNTFVTGENYSEASTINAEIEENTRLSIEQLSNQPSSSTFYIPETQYATLRTPKEKCPNSASALWQTTVATREFAQTRSSRRTIDRLNMKRLGSSADSSGCQKRQRTRLGSVSPAFTLSSLNDDNVIQATCDVDDESSSGTPSLLFSDDKIQGSFKSKVFAHQLKSTPLNSRLSDGPDFLAALPSDDQSILAKGTQFYDECSQFNLISTTPPNFIAETQALYSNARREFGSLMRHHALGDPVETRMPSEVSSLAMLPSQVLFSTDIRQLSPALGDFFGEKEPNSSNETLMHDEFADRTEYTSHRSTLASSPCPRKSDPSTADAAFFLENPIDLFANTPTSATSAITPLVKKKVQFEETVAESRAHFTAATSASQMDADELRDDSSKPANLTNNQDMVVEQTKSDKDASDNHTINKGSLHSRTKLFEGHSFIITAGTAEKEDCIKATIKALLIENGGRIVDLPEPNTICISPSPLRTAKYFLAVVHKIPRVSHMLITDSLMAGCLLESTKYIHGESYISPPADGEYTEVLVGMRFHLNGPPKFVNSWAPIITKLGGRLCRLDTAEASLCDAVVISDASYKSQNCKRWPKLVKAAFQAGIPVTGIDWIVAVICTGKRPQNFVRVGPESIGKCQ